MKKFFAIALASALSLTLLAGCGEKGGNEENTDPTISGVKAEETIEVGQEFDALKGVTASDKEDGDLTAQIKVSASGLTFTDGKTTPTVASEYSGYEIVYSVTDSDGAEAKEYCTLYVKPAAGAETTFKSYTDFNIADQTIAANTSGDGTETSAALDWWRPYLVNGAAEGQEIDGNVKLTKGSLVFHFANLPAIGDDKAQLTRTFDKLTAGTYELIVWAKSSVATKINMTAILQGENDWETSNLKLDGSERYNLAVGTEFTKVSAKFALTDELIAGIENKQEGDAANEAHVMFRIGLSSDDAGNPRPTAFDFTFYKIAIYQTVGQDSKQDLYTQDFSAAAQNAVEVQTGDNAAATTTYDATAKAQKVEITAYPTNKEVWNVKVDLALPDVSITSGSQYSYTFKVTATKAQAGEIVVESKTQSGDMRANFESFSIGEGETKTVTKTFTAEKGVTDPVIRLQIGTPSENVTANTLTFDDIVFSKTDEKTVNKANSYFMPARRVMKDTAFDTAYPFDIGNGSDEGSSTIVPGLGVLYTEDKNLVYHVFQGSSTDWHNKLVVGFKENPLALKGNSYYKVRIKIKASKELTCPVIALHEIDTGWDSGMIKKLENQKIGTDWTTIELDMETYLPGDKNCELLLQFGSPTFETLGEVKIEVAEIAILQRALIG